MSTTPEQFQTWLQTNFGGLSLQQKAHTIQRLYEKLRLIHNAVGDVYQHRKTITEFQAQYPAVYSVIAPELAPYVDGDYLSLQGWTYFVMHMFDPRHLVISRAAYWLKEELRNTVAEYDLEPVT